MRKILKHVLIFGLTAVACFGVYVNRVPISDYFKARSYTPSAEIAALRDDLLLTPKGLRIFNATHPVLDSRDDFNRDCNSSDPGIAVYGCYYLDRIYVYDIDAEELAGIRESTAAHELLHAVWARLPGLEKNTLVPLIETVYSEHKSFFDKTLETYNDSERLDELYVRVGTQIKNLPPALESHYAEIFSDQDAIVSFYDAYAAQFEKYNRRLEALNTEMSELSRTIDEKTATYESRAATFSEKVAEFNSCAATAGCFSSRAVFDSTRATLSAEQNSLNDLYSELSALVDSYNSKVDEYNSNALSLDTLQNLANSNSELKPLEE